MKKVTIDTSSWPVVVITQHVPQLSDDERLAVMRESDEVLNARPGPYSLVLDNRRAGPVPPKQRALIAEHMQKNAERTRLRCMSTAFVLESAVMRGVITAILWLKPPGCETRVFGELDAAMGWVRERHQVNIRAKVVI